VHNKRKVKSTKNRVPFIIHYYETVETKEKRPIVNIFQKHKWLSLFKRTQDYLNYRVVGSPEGTPLEESH